MLRLGVVPWHAKAKLIHRTEFVLGVGIILIRRLFVPFRCLSEVLEFGTPGVLIDLVKFVLSGD